MMLMWFVIKTLVERSFSSSAAYSYTLTLLQLKTKERGRLYMLGSM